MFQANKSSYALREYLLSKNMLALDEAGFPQLFPCQSGPRALKGSYNVQAFLSLIWPGEKLGSTKKKNKNKK